MVLNLSIHLFDLIILIGKISFGPYFAIQVSITGNI